jgi:hypothetical protein
VSQQAKVDIVREYKDEYATPKAPMMVRTRPAKYLAADGSGPPGDDAFQDMIGATYGVAYTIKFTKKKAGQDFKVAPLEGLWWPDPEPSNWRWRLLIRMPDFVEEEDLEQAALELRRKGKGEQSDRIRLETLDEGECVQMLHVGPYDAEQPTMDAMHAFAQANGFDVKGPHHEIYLSDPRRVAPEKIRTILRYSVVRK